MSYFSSLQQYAGALATVAAGAIIARVIETMQSGSQDQQAERVDPTAGVDYKPTPLDVVVVRIMLEKAMKFPPEILDIIIDHAEYWPHSEASVENTTPGHRNPLSVMGGRDENKFLLRCPPIGFLDFKKVGPAFKTAPLPPKWVDGSISTQPLGHVTLQEKAPVSSEADIEAPRETFARSMNQPPALTHPVRKIVFKIRSRDQGWGGSRREDGGPYAESWTWFEAGLERFNKDRQCDGLCKKPVQTPETQAENAGFENPDAANLCTCGLQSIYPPVVQTDGGKLAYHHFLHPLDNLQIQANRKAHKQMMDHEVVWSWTDDIHPESPEADHLVEIGRGRGTGTGKFVRDLQLGDVVTVWAKARFGGWTNYPESVKVEIYWAI
ncbi:hypothetical protein CCHL11_00779 [Colletotrichum chlorophyti]|uniref:Uncharacterized protein n=1 Tax=Colletotrichum chlorophyti TaxID=708187 RepID=A0A1Q8S516_9PEZI|nr:hypothetical protein CCHL11_00779 [Colletotrichum chlorophyti]